MVIEALDAVIHVFDNEKTGNKSGVFNYSHCVPSHSRPGSDLRVCGQAGIDRRCTSIA